MLAKLHPGAAESCDGLDTNCDGAPYTVTQCSPPAATCGAGSTDGVQLCRDLGGGTPIGECVGSPACRCRLGNPGPCSKCILAFEGTASPLRPCAPSASRIALLGPCDPTRPCNVDVVQIDGPWEAGVAASLQGDFERRATVTANEVFLRIKPLQSPLPAAPASSVGGVHVVASGATAATQVQYFGLDLELANLRIDSCATAPMLGSFFGMVCSP